MNQEEWIIFSENGLKEMFVTVYTNVGEIFGLGMYLFLIVISLLALIEVVKKVGQ